MSDEEEEENLPAGDFSAWLRAMLAALRDEAAADVPCGGCTACCTASQFVHIEPGETDTLAHIPPELLFPAPGRPRGHVLLGHDEQGRRPLRPGHERDPARRPGRREPRAVPAVTPAPVVGPQPARKPRMWPFTSRGFSTSMK